MCIESAAATTTAPHIPDNECIAEYLDARILQHVAYYAVTVAGTSKMSDFYETPVDDRADYVCRQFGANPDTFEDATELQSLRVLRRLNRNADAGRYGEAGQISVPTLGAFWHAVDRTMHWQIGEFVKDESGLSIPAYEEMKPNAKNLLCVIGDYAIQRTEITDRYTVVYSAEELER